jgi:hypothetical protein
VTTGAGSPWFPGNGLTSSGGGSSTVAVSVVAKVHDDPVQYRLRDGVQKSGYQPGGAPPSLIPTILPRPREASRAAVGSTG